MEPEADYGTTEVYARVQAGSGQADQGARRLAVAVELLDADEEFSFFGFPEFMRSGDGVFADASLELEAEAVRRRDLVLPVAKQDFRSGAARFTRCRFIARRLTIPDRSFLI